MTQQFDLIVVGTGIGGSIVARRCSKAGWKVAIVDARNYGGTCALRGCNPKKVLVQATAAIDAIRRLDGKGVEGDVRIHWPTLMRFKRSFTEPVPKRSEQSFAEAGIATYHESARFVGPSSLEVGGERLEARHIHIATGAKPSELSFYGAEHLSTSDEFLNIDELPHHLVFVGGGYISLEFAHLAARAGRRSTVLEVGERPLARMDPEVGSLLLERTRALGIDVRVQTKIEAIERDGKELVVTARTNDEESVRLSADMVVHGAGRVPDIADLDLRAAGIEHDAAGIEVNTYMQSISNSAVYAAGDAAKGGLPLSSVASFEAHVAASNLLGGNKRRIEYPPIPTVVFTLPPFASVGLQESEARKAGLKFRSRFGRSSQWFSSQIVGEEFSGFKVLVEEETERILGAHILGPNASELINLFALAMRCKLTVRDIKTTIFAYPTPGSDMASMM